jgi:hypothetical protein
MFYFMISFEFLWPMSHLVAYDQYCFKAFLSIDSALLNLL